MSIDFKNLLSVPDATETKIAHIRSRLQTQKPAFASDKSLLAIFAFGGTMAAINAFDHTGQKGIVFAHFHGKIYTGDALEKLNLHLPAFKPKFARPLVEVR